MSMNEEETVATTRGHWPEPSLGELKNCGTDKKGVRCERISTISSVDFHGDLNR